MALVFGVILAANCSGSRLKVLKSISTKIGVAPQYSTTLAVETQVNAGTITSSPDLLHKRQQQYAML